MSEKLSIIIPMAGLGSRLRPLTWSRPKPLVSLAGATVLDHLLAMFKCIADRDDVEYVFIMSPGQQPLIQAHMQITVWSKQRAEAFAAMRAIEPAMRAAQAFTSRPLGAPESDYDADTKLHGARQDYLCTHAR